MRLLILIYLLISAPAFSQILGELSVEKIMRDSKWMGSSPGDPFWSDDGKRLYFTWNPEGAESDSLYFITPQNQKPQKVSNKEARKLPVQGGELSRDLSKKVYEKDGDIYLSDIRSGKITQITNTLERESNPEFLLDDFEITWLAGSGLFVFNYKTSSLRQVAIFKSGKKEEKAKKSENEQWLESQQYSLFDFLREKKTEESNRKARQEANRMDKPAVIYTGDKSAEQIKLSPDARFITFNLVQRPKIKLAPVPNYLTESAYSELINTRTKVGSTQAANEFAIYIVQKDTVLFINKEQIPGIYDEPDYRKEYKSADTSGKAKQIMRDLNYYGTYWSSNGKKSFMVITSQDNKDRWLMKLTPDSARLSLIDRQRDEAWIGGPGIYGSYSAGNVGWMPDNEQIWFQSERTGYSQLYAAFADGSRLQPLTEGNYEILSATISIDKKWWNIKANKEGPEEVHFYRMPLNGGKMEKITRLKGRHDAAPDPAGQWLASRYSFSNKPWEIYFKKLDAKQEEKRITFSTSKEFESYNWQIPDLIRFKARDGAEIPARLYKPKQPDPNRPAVIFVHGAGYLQNAHSWWSSYFREYMFHNLLADKGYYVLDIDYRGSAGYGRDWRTAIYRHMGGKDLDDHVDGKSFLVKIFGIDSNRVGIYGGSYGGFITFMALFTQPGMFKAGAALRPVADWAQYNHGYTSNILNEPSKDSIAFARSSPINFAHNLRDRLLICHGMLDTNVHFQDVVMLSQRLIELGKENWELAVYPIEDHGFKKPSSWTDEYRRILKLFEEELKP